MKLAIIGAGPAGLTAAIKAAKHGWEVTVFEKGRVGEGIKCAEGFLDSLKLVGKPPAGVRNQVKRFLIQGTEEYTLDLAGIDLWMIDRREWQLALADEARNAKVKIHENYAVDNQELIALKGNFDWVIDASGVFSATSRLHGFAEHYRQHSAFTIQYVLQGDFSRFQETIKIGIEPHYVGYYWIFPKGPEVANVGVIWYDAAGVVAPEAGAQKELARILEKEGLVDYQIIKRMGGLCPYKMPPRLVYDNVLLVGDSAGLTSPLHGGGIDMACISGALAVDCLAEGRVDDYRQEVLSTLGAKLQVEEKLLALWGNLSYEEINLLFQMLARDWWTLSLKSLKLYPLRIVREMATIVRFWRGMVTGDYGGVSWLQLSKYVGKRLDG